MSLSGNNIDIVPISGYSPNFTWQVGFNTTNGVDLDNLTFRATVRPLNGYEDLTRVPSAAVLYEQTGLIIDGYTHQGKWSFPLAANTAISGGPYRDYQVVIEAHDSNGNTSAGNLVGTDNENGWTAFGQGYDVLAVFNPRQTGIELGSNLPTQISIGTGNTLFGLTGSGYYFNSGRQYFSYNYLGTHGEINIRYINGTFDSNLVGGFLYVWTGQFPKLETLLQSGVYGTNVIKSQFDFDPLKPFIYHPSAATPFRGATNVYVSVSFFDNLDAEALDNKIDISTGLYLSDNAIAYNDIAAGSISIGGQQTIYSVQYSGNASPTGILGTGTAILASQYYNGSTTVLYLSNPAVIASFQSNYTGVVSNTPGGMGGNAILFNNQPITQSFQVQWSTDAITFNPMPVNTASPVYIKVTSSVFDLSQVAVMIIDIPDGSQDGSTTTSTTSTATSDIAAWSIFVTPSQGSTNILLEDFSSNILATIVNGYSWNVP